MLTSQRTSGITLRPVVLVNVLYERGDENFFPGERILFCQITIFWVFLGRGIYLPLLVIHKSHTLFTPSRKVGFHLFFFCSYVSVCF